MRPLQARSFFLEGKRTKRLTQRGVPQIPCERRPVAHGNHASLLTWVLVRRSDVACGKDRQPIPWAIAALYAAFVRCRHPALAMHLYAPLREDT